MVDFRMKYRLVFVKVTQNLNKGIAKVLSKISKSNL